VEEAEEGVAGSPMAVEAEGTPAWDRQAAEGFPDRSAGETGRREQADRQLSPPVLTGSARAGLTVPAESTPHILIVPVRGTAPKGRKDRIVRRTRVIPDIQATGIMVTGMAGTAAGMAAGTGVGMNPGGHHKPRS